MNEAKLGRHQRCCTVCHHPQREEIDRDFINWKSPAVIAKEYELADRTSVYRHAHALGLFEKRRRNIRAALERIIERAGEVDVTAGAVVQAVVAYAKINAADPKPKNCTSGDLRILPNDTNKAGTGPSSGAQGAVGDRAPREAFVGFEMT
jgi:hypothetical protein